MTANDFDKEMQELVGSSESETLEQDKRLYEKSVYENCEYPQKFSPRLISTELRQAYLWH